MSEDSLGFWSRAVHWGMSNRTVLYMYGTIARNMRERCLKLIIIYGWLLGFWSLVKFHELSIYYTHTIQVLGSYKQIPDANFRRIGNRKGSNDFKWCSFSTFSYNAPMAETCNIGIIDAAKWYSQFGHFLFGCSLWNVHCNFVATAYTANPHYELYTVLSSAMVYFSMFCCSH